MSRTAQIERKQACYNCASSPLSPNMKFLQFMEDKHAIWERTIETLGSVHLDCALPGFNSPVMCPGVLSQMVSGHHESWSYTRGSSRNLSYKQQLLTQKEIKRAVKWKDLKLTGKCSTQSLHLSPPTPAHTHTAEDKNSLCWTCRKWEAQQI